VTGPASTGRPAGRRRIAIAAAVVALALGVVATRAVWQGRAALERGDRALEAGDAAAAIKWWRRAARWYVPLAPHVASAYARLEELAGQAEAAGDRTTALAAWQGVRSSILATRGLYLPFEDHLAPANQRIATLMAAWEGELGQTGSVPAAERASRHLALLQHDPAPAVGWTLVALAGFALWLGGAGLFAWRAVDPTDRLVRRTAALSGLMVAAGLVVWLVGLYRA
jgi:hypothetical protein